MPQGGEVKVTAASSFKILEYNLDRSLVTRFLSLPSSHQGNTSVPLHSLTRRSSMGSST